MTLSTRDNQIVRTVNRFQQLTAAQIFALCFAGGASTTPVKRALARLVAGEYLARVELQRLVGGSRGGAGQYVYQLGRRGFGLYNEGLYKKSRRINYHQLLVADSLLAIAERSAELGWTIQYPMTGQDAAHRFGDIEVRPDMRINIKTQDGSQRFYWVEVDMATEGKRQIQDKLARTWQAMRMTDPADYPTAPLVLWVACDEERAKELQWIIDHGQDDGRKAYFKVCTLATLSKVLN